MCSKDKLCFDPKCQNEYYLISIKKNSSTFFGRAPSAMRRSGSGHPLPSRYPRKAGAGFPVLSFSQIGTYRAGHAWTPNWFTYSLLANAKIHTFWQKMSEILIP